MATGIVSVGLHEAGWVRVSDVLLDIAAAAFVVLAVLYVVRFLRYRERVRADLRNPEVAFGYFTVVAASDVLAVGLLVRGWTVPATVLLVFAAAVWLVLGYLLPWQVLMVRDGSPILERVNGSWFIWSVASQSLAVGLSAVETSSPQWSALVGTFAVMAWSVGTLLYAAIAIVVILRIVHHGMTPEQFDPTYWVSMGALAIAVVAGAGIVEMPSVPVVDAARGLIGGTVVIVWCFAVWLVPLLLAAGAWRHFVRRVPLRYVPSLWSMVFPMGMLAMASMRLGRVESLAAIRTFGFGFLVVAVTAWALVAAALIVSAGRRR